MTNEKEKKIELRIEQLRKKLYEASENGKDREVLLKLSEELDVAINEYLMLKNNND